MVDERGMEEDVVLGWRRNCSLFKCYGIESVERKKAMVLEKIAGNGI